MSDYYFEEVTMKWKWTKVRLIETIINYNFTFWLSLLNFNCLSFLGVRNSFLQRGLLKYKGILWSMNWFKSLNVVEHIMNYKLFLEITKEVISYDGVDFNMSHSLHQHFLRLIFFLKTLQRTNVQFIPTILRSNVKILFILTLNCYPRRRIKTIYPQFLPWKCCLR